MRELALHVLDILQNAVEAGATTVELTVEEDTKADRLTITVADNGRGMAPEAAARAVDPFFTSRTTRHVGLGLPLWAAAARRAGGDLAIRSAPGAGTTVTATFTLSYPDRQPMGDLPGTIMAFLLAGMPVDLRYRHSVDGQAFELDSADLRAVLQEVPLSHPSVRRWLGQYLAEGESGLNSKAG